MCDIKFVSVVNDNNNDYKICRLDRNDTGLYQLRMNSISILRAIPDKYQKYVGTHSNRSE